MGLHYIFQHLYKPGTYARILLWTSAPLSTPSSRTPFRINGHSSPSHLHLSVDHQLPDRQPAASEAGKILIQHPHHQHWCSSWLCSLPHCSSPSTPTTAPLKTPSVKLLKFADDTTLIGLIKDGDESAYRQEVKELAVWCSLNNLELNTLKTVEMIVDFRRNPPALPPLTIMTTL